MLACSCFPPSAGPRYERSGGTSEGISTDVPMDIRNTLGHDDDVAVSGCWLQRC